MAKKRFDKNKKEYFKQVDSQSNIIIIIALLIALIGVIGGTIIYFQNNGQYNKELRYFNNEVVAYYESRIMNDEENFNNIKVKNNGDRKVVVRLNYKLVIKDGEGNLLDLVILEQDVLNLKINLDDWSYENGYYYYNKTLNKGEETTTFLKGIKYSDVVLNDEDFKVKYSNAKVFLEVNVEMIDEDAREVIWK